MTFSGIILSNRIKQIRFYLVIYCICLLVSLFPTVFAVASGNSDPSIHLIKPDPRGGIGYQLVYYVNVPLDTYWRFKTDFAGSYLSTNKLIKAHRLIRTEGDSVITKNSYTVGPDVTYLWRTKVFNGKHRLEYSLLNPKECGQRFHYGYIQAAAEGDKTKVTQVAHLDFFGVSFWAHFPWGGGMTDFLKSTARWEQKTASRLEWKYEAKNK